MTLQQIDERLSLYHLYLSYYLDWMWPNLPFFIGDSLWNIRPMSPIDLLNLYQQTGNMYFSSPDTEHENNDLLSYDEWLIKNDYANLAMPQPVVGPVAEVAVAVD